MTTDKQYRVSYGRIAMPAGTDGKYYQRRECQDGTVTFLPVQSVPAPATDQQ